MALMFSTAPTLRRDETSEGRRLCDAMREEADPSCVAKKERGAASVLSVCEDMCARARSRIEESVSERLRRAAGLTVAEGVLDGVCD
jgi:hypothetical protein